MGKAGMPVHHMDPFPCAGDWIHAIHIHHCGVMSGYRQYTVDPDPPFLVEIHFHAPGNTQVLVECQYSFYPVSYPHITEQGIFCLQGRVGGFI